MATNNRDRSQSRGRRASASSNPGNFANDRERAREAGRKGGQASRSNRGESRGSR